MILTSQRSGEQLNITAIGSIDNCCFGGFQVPGYVEGNPIVIKYWSAEGEFECAINHPEFLVGSGDWGEPFTGVSLQVPETCVFAYGCAVDPMVNNLLSFNFYPDEPLFATLFEDIAFMAWDDMGGFYVPSYGIDQIGHIDILKGYKVFSAQDEQAVLFATGLPADPGQPIMWQPNMNNLFAYLPQQPMLAEDVLGPFDDDILIVSNDAGEYYVPSLDVHTLTIMYPCEGYQVFTQRETAVMFSYPLGGLIRHSSTQIARDSYRDACRSQLYSPQCTGISQPVIITDYGNHVQRGDEIAVYAHGELVGAGQVADLDQPLAVSCWQAVEEFGISLPGFSPGDEIELRHRRTGSSPERPLSVILNSHRFGETPLVVGSITSDSESNIPRELRLLPAYPNPFNATVSLQYELAGTRDIDLRIYDLQGRSVATLLQGYQSAGRHTVQWQAGSAASGVYLVQLSVGDQIRQEKILLLK